MDKSFRLQRADRVPSYACVSRMLPHVLIGILAFHCLAASALFYFSWSAFITATVLGVVTYLLGITVCFHRLLAHQSFRTHSVLRGILALLGALAFQGGPLTWVAIHRLHHRSPDRAEDPHTPCVSFVWAHLGWFIFRHPELVGFENRLRFVRDLEKDSVLLCWERWYYPLNAASATALFLTGFFISGVNFGLSMLLWGYFARIVLVWHLTFSVNSVCHMWGYRNCATADESRNNWLVGILGFGEGWHNNHHACPGSACFGRRWYEFDVGYWTIQLLQFFALASEIRLPPTFGTAPTTAEAIGSHEKGTG